MLQSLYHYGPACMMPIISTVYSVNVTLFIRLITHEVASHLKSTLARCFAPSREIILGYIANYQAGC